MSACTSTASEATAGGVRKPETLRPSRVPTPSTAPAHSACVGIGWGRSSIASCTLPGWGASTAPPWWNQARSRSIAHARMTRSVTSGRNPCSGSTLSTQRRT